jgi:translocation and assembly module TamB
MRLENGEIKIKDIPQKFSALNGTIDFNRERIVIDSLAGDVGGGGMKLSGWVQLAHFLPGEFSTRVAFDNVTVRYPPGLVSTLSGVLYYDGDASEQDLSGDVVIKRALYDKRVEWKSMLLETFKGFSQKRKTEIGWIGETQLNIRFHGKDNILIQNNLAKIPIEVDTFIRGTPSQPQLLGRLEARTGVVYFRRNDFKIQHASVDFVDPNRINPVLDIQAESRVREYIIRLAVSGAADRATVTFISDPPLSEMDVMSMLALGKTSADLKGKGTEVGMSEAASLATGQFQDIFEQRARSLTGLDRFQVDPYLSKDTSVPRVTVGKELVQDKLYFTYSSNVGTTTPDTVFRIEYVLDKHFSLVGEQNELGTIGGDVKFRFEFK